MKSNWARTFQAMALSAAFTLTLTSCHGILVNSRTDELTWLGRMTIKSGNLTHRVGSTDEVLLPGAFRSPALSASDPAAPCLPPATAGATLQTNPEP